MCVHWRTRVFLGELVIRWFDPGFDGGFPLFGRFGSSLPRHAVCFWPRSPVFCVKTPFIGRMPAPPPTATLSLTSRWVGNGGAFQPRVVSCGLPRPFPIFFRNVGEHFLPILGVQRSLRASLASCLRTVSAASWSFPGSGLSLTGAFLRLGLTPYSPRL